MDTQAAALQAHVTVATVRGWCRRGVVAAVKRAGRWVIDSVSLGRRLTIGLMKKREKSTVEDVKLTAEIVEQLGGKRWQKGGKDRVYLDNWRQFVPLEIESYRSGSISYAAWEGEKISNAEAGRIICMAERVWFCADDRKVHVSGYGSARTLTAEQLADHITRGLIKAAATKAR